jgi:hypothetical protein
MKKTSKVIFVVLCGLIFLGAELLQAALPERTYVKTTQSLIPIANLEARHEVIGYNPQASDPASIFSKSALQGWSSKTKEHELLCITTPSGSFYASYDQLFYDPVKVLWQEARELTNKSTLLNSKFEFICCLAIESVRRYCTLYEIMFEEPHTFFITEQEILTHNHPITFAAALGGTTPLLATPAGPVVAGAAIVAMSAYGIISLFKKHKHKHQDCHAAVSSQPEHAAVIEQPVVREISLPSPTPEPPQDPKKDDEEKDKLQQEQKNQDSSKQKITIDINRIKDPKSNTRRHIFGKSSVKHQVAKLSGTEDEILDKFIESTQKALDAGKIPEKGEFKIYDVIDGHEITVEGCVHDNQVKVATAYVNEGCC